MILFLTVTAAMALGVVLGYGLFVSILHLVGNHQRLAPVPELAHQVNSGGD
jgi:hypothetical protein